MEARVVRKKWLARLVTGDGDLVRAIPMDWGTPPSTVPGFFVFGGNSYQVAAPCPLRPQKRFNRTRILRSDYKLTIVEYRRVLRCGRG
jgi:hypothetical protein